MMLNLAFCVLLLVDKATPGGRCLAYAEGRDPGVYALPVRPDRPAPSFLIGSRAPGLTPPPPPPQYVTATQSGDWNALTVKIWDGSSTVREYEDRIARSAQDPRVWMVED